MLTKITVEQIIVGYVPSKKKKINKMIHPKGYL
jgi:hypothetical protein